MFRQCDMQQGREVLRGWIPERGAKEGAEIEIKGLEGLWKVTRVHGYSLTDDGLKRMQDFHRRWHNNI
jgi:hypothetical protein